MPNESYIFVCPFFHKTLGNNLYCESFYNDSELPTIYNRLDFATRIEQRKYIKRYCSTYDYFHCKIAATNFAFHAQNEHQRKLAKMCLGYKQVNK